MVTDDVPVVSFKLPASYDTPWLCAFARRIVESGAYVAGQQPGVCLYRRAANG